MKKAYISNDQSDTFFYFEIIKETAPKSILDADMFLRRIGAISKSVGDLSMTPHTLLDGIDFFPEYDFPIYHTIYDNIFDPKDDIITKYDLSILTSPMDIFSKDETSKLIDRLSSISSRIALGIPDEKELSLLSSYGKVTDLHVDDKLYALVSIS